MSITLGELLDDFTEIADKDLKGLNPKIAESFAETVGIIIETSIIEQIYGKEGIKTIDSLEIPGSTIIQDLTLLSINEELEITLFEDNIYSNFTAFLKSNEEIEMFDLISDLYDKYGKDGIVDEIEEKNLLNKASIKSPIYDLLNLLLKGNEMTNSLMIILKNKGIDPINNSLVKPPKEVTIFLDNFKNHVLSLVNTGGKSTYFVGSGSGAMN